MAPCFVRVAVQAGGFDVTREMAAFSQPGIGGIGCFVGVVRGAPPLVAPPLVATPLLAPPLVALTLEHYPGMTERAIGRIVDEAVVRFALLACTVIHRIGRLEVGAPIVLVLAGAAHRAASLEATAFLIDWLKTSAPFWKREEFEDGSHDWVQARESDLKAVDRWACPPHS